MNNRFNPDPNKEVQWGDQSWDEMMVGFFNLVFPANTSVETINPPHEPMIPYELWMFPATAGRRWSTGKRPQSDGKLRPTIT
ncbi:hypothetical protein [Paludibaculum fermentans]|uniref:hypothetical protein n=1 Tax=Paludibaculum fermentans TaxID=1473598 RepID=UPI003EB89A94